MHQSKGLYINELCTKVVLIEVINMVLVMTVKDVLYLRKIVIAE